MRALYILAIVVGCVVVVLFSARLEVGCEWGDLERGLWVGALGVSLGAAIGFGFGVFTHRRGGEQ